MEDGNKVKHTNSDAKVTRICMTIGSLLYFREQRS